MDSVRSWFYVFLYSDGIHGGFFFDGIYLLWFYDFFCKVHALVWCEVTWNYRVLRRRTKDIFGREVESYGVHEVYYDDDGEPSSCTMNSVGPSGDTFEDLAADLRLLVAALNKPILEYDSFLEKEEEEDQSE